MKMGGMNFQYLLEKLQKHFDGIYYDGQYPIVNMFVPLEVHKIDFEK
jgi:hypothetical protein